jgi:gamma-D-glutamyl-L-lysine dipeptidyl-peptidase
MAEVFAFCQVNLSPIRSNSSDASEMVSQLLFGEVVCVKKTNSPWVKILTILDNYEGFVDEKHLTIFSHDEAESWLKKQKPQSQLLLEIVGENGIQKITRGAFCSDEIEFSIGSKKFKIVAENNISQNFSFDKIVHSYLNTPYLWGGKSPFGIDCSGFTQIVFRFLNIFLPRDAYQQAEFGQTISFSEIKPKDLVFFVNQADKIHHVGIAWYDNQIIHASGWVRMDNLLEDGIYNLNRKAITHKLCLIKRII